MGVADKKIKELAKEDTYKENFTIKLSYKVQCI
jgi:hypothetical protein